MVLMEYSGAWGTLIYEKNLKSKFSCQTPFKFIITTVTEASKFILSILLLPRVRISIILMRIRIAAFLFNTDPDPGPHQIYNTKVKSMLRILEKIHIGSVTGSGFGSGSEINCKVDPDRQHILRSSRAPF